MANITNSPSSLDNQYSRYVQGGTTDTNNIGLGWWERKIFEKDPSDLIYYVENKYANRLDLISDAFYGDARYWWVIAQYNNILDPYSEIVPGLCLVVPTKDRLFSEIFTS
jgi:hypothetical protein